MGIIMVVGVSTANSVLVTTFAKLRSDEGLSALRAAIEAATTRLRPVLMTASAMILGVIPMAIGHAEGGEQNAPLGRAVIGGLVFGTCASLFLVPVVFAAVRKRFDRKDENSSRVRPNCSRTLKNLPAHEDTRYDYFLLLPDRLGFRGRSGGGQNFPAGSSNQSRALRSARSHRTF